MHICYFTKLSNAKNGMLLGFYAFFVFLFFLIHCNKYFTRHTFAQFDLQAFYCSICRACIATH